MNNKVILQGFEWDLPADSQHWNKLKEMSKEIKEYGFTAIWLPPAYKGTAGSEDVGYGVYDYYDLGEFDQKGSVPTKYGTKDEYLEAIKALQEQGIEVYADIVFNHLIGADEKEVVPAVKYNTENRNEPISDEEEIEAWTKFTFPGRQGSTMITFGRGIIFLVSIMMTATKTTGFLTSLIRAGKTKWMMRWAITTT